jgi:tetratricopeptide (TPR) repeat protein
MELEKKILKLLFDKQKDKSKEDSILIKNLIINEKIDFAEAIAIIERHMKLSNIDVIGDIKKLKKTKKIEISDIRIGITKDGIEYYFKNFVNDTIKSPVLFRLKNWLGSMTGILTTCLILIGGLIGIYKVFKPSKKPGAIFSASDIRFKVLILPFRQACTVGGITYDIGYEIRSRLEALKLTDTLNITTHYFTDSLDLRNFTSEDADSMMKYHNADQIIYGSYYLQACDGGSSDKVCFNYKTNPRKSDYREETDKVDNSLIDISGLGSIRNGTGQKDIDFIIYMVSSIAAFDDWEFSRTLRLLQKIKNFDENEDILLTMGTCYMALGDKSNARLYTEKVLKLNRNNDRAWANLGVIVSENDPASAKEYFESAIRINPNSFLALTNFGRYYEGTKEYSKAIEYYEKALKIVPNDGAILTNLGIVYTKMHDLAKAKECFDQLALISPNEIMTWVSFGDYYAMSMDFSNADKCFKKARNINSKNDVAHFWIGFYYFNRSEFEIAKESFEKAVKLKPDISVYWAALGKVYLSLGNQDKAKECYEKARELNSSIKSVFSK